MKKYFMLFFFFFFTSLLYSGCVVHARGTVRSSTPPPARHMHGDGCGHHYWHGGWYNHAHPGNCNHAWHGHRHGPGCGHHQHQGRWYVEIWWK